jgi:hypothetical protein
VRFGWQGLPGQSFEFQLARDDAFSQIVLEKRLTETEVELPQPGQGRFLLRLRAIEADGFVGPHSTPQYFDLPNCLRDNIGGCVRASGTPLVARP